MSAPLRFLALAIVGWAGIRAATLGIIPGGEAFRVARTQPAPPPIVPTAFPPLEPVQAAYVPTAASYAAAGYPPPPMPAAVPYYYYPVAVPPPQAPPTRRARYTPLLPEPQALYYPREPDDAPMSRLASTLPGRSSTPATAPGVPAVQPKRLDRLQLSMWALLRGRPGTGSLATGGTLGGSQAGARLTYALDPRLALSLRSYSPLGGARGSEVAVGVRLTPIPSIPVSITAERRQAIGRYGGRSAFALFAEGGVYQQPLPWKLSLDGYAQAGVVGVRSRDLFADGGFTVTRPVLGAMSYGNRPLFGSLSAGFGIWGGVQPDLYRIDAGPRVSVAVRRNVYIHVDWRQRLAGTAEPVSGPAVTLAGNF